jgi:anaerobic magnesium-protoporphyrin IX monomethyl ester cyclase
MGRARLSLIYPSDGLCYKFARARTRRMPLGLAYVAAAAERAGHDVHVVDGALDDLSVEETVTRALACDPEFVGLGCTTPLYHMGVKIIDQIKRVSPATTVIFGGPHVSALPAATLRTSRADFVAIGEGEESLVAIMDAVSNSKDPSAIPSIAFRSGGDSKVTDEYRLRLSQPTVNTVKAIDLNRIPVPARHLFEYTRYLDCARDVHEPQTNTMFSRGCPGKCSFCGAADTLVRFRDLTNVLDELELVQSMGIRNVFVMDDTYTSQKQRILKLSRQIVDRGIDLNISVQLRLDQIDREICDAMCASGVRYVGPGIESGNEEIIKQIGKGPRESKHHMREKMKLLQEYGWRVRCSYVMGMPGETEEQIMETIQFAKELGADENAFSIVVPYPDSPLWHVAEKAGKVHEAMDFSKFLYYHEIGCNLSAVSTERLLELHEFAYAYVGNPAYKLDDDSVSSGHRPHIPYLVSEAFKRHRQALQERKLADEPDPYAYDAYDRRHDAEAREPTMTGSASGSAPHADDHPRPAPRSQRGV